MNRLEQFVRPRDVRIEIVHDNIVRFDDLLGLVRGMFRESDGSDFLVINGSIRFFSMPTVDSIRLGDSKDEPFINLPTYWPASCAPCSRSSSVASALTRTNVRSVETS
jgi:hypothetical protein